MQNKGLVKLFAVLFGLVSIYQLSFTFKNNAIENNAAQVAESKIDASADDRKNQVSEYATKYLDSLATSKESVFLGNTYGDVKQNSMKLGLDLRGGLEAILQISVRDLLMGLSNESKDPTFRKALDDADEMQKDSQNTYLDDFFTAFDAIKGDKKLASPDIFANRSLVGEIDLNMSDSDAKAVLATKVDESIVSAFEVLRKRIDEFGVTSPNIQRLGNSGRVLLELPGVKDVARATELITTTAQLEFWEGLKAEQFNQFLVQANDVLKAKLETKTTEGETPAADTEMTDEEKAIAALTGEENETVNEVNPLLDLIAGPGFGATLAQFNIEDKDKVLSYLAMPEVVALLPSELKYTKFLFGKPAEDSELVDLFVLNGNRDNEPPLNGAVVTDARQSYNQANKVVVSMQMNSKGAKIWEKMTGDAFKTQSQIAVVLDNTVYSAPTSSSGPIAGGSTEISGSFKLSEATDLANVLRAGKLPARAEIIQSSIVGPSLGQEAIESGTMSFGIALALVLIWMAFYYGKAGLFADIAMLFNILLIFGVLSGIGAVLTLPGIAGIVLTIGMSVDANVLIFERIREELSKGKDQKSAIQDGFSNALSSILDANITTGLTALILFVFGTGPIKGFATTLLIGIGTSLFTAIFITRLLVDWYANRGGKLDFSTGLTKNLFRNINIAFLTKRKVAYIISAVALVVSLGSLFTNGLDQGIDFVGGRTTQVRFAEPVSAVEIEGLLASQEVFGSATVKTVGDDNNLKISTKYKINETANEIDEEVRVKMYDALQPYLKGVSFEDFKDLSKANKQVGIMDQYKVSPSIADDIKQASFWAVLGSLVVVFLYILFRFKRWQFSLGAVAAVFHDVIIVLGVFSLTYKFMPFSMEIDQAFIAAILTVIGYSLNDTVVVFDRIREFFNEHTDWPFNKVIDTSLSSTLSRTLNTSLTTLVVLLAIFIFGGDSIRGFMFALIIGVVVGTYSSLFIATPIMFDFVKKGNAADALKKKEVVVDETVVK
ncbi:protein translocase subunit SecDF [Olleya sp. UBA1516]|uniref:protein translocase subunit SecDF n=1 Tax=Olleya sp. UBA1516 TaxID=1947013 RepID=UPI0025D6078B|nr:protein translocase subunit SecDF [Olleya sp. UBA1516]|tara:strand:- start:8671 stop:11682 length:3012 start_codon:yes stop_codon:yes gene_type:complete